MSGVLPLIFGAGSLAAAGSMPLYRETDWDFRTNKPVWRSGSPVFVTGARAVLVWAWNALHTERFAHDVFSADYGPDFTGLIGQSYTEEVRQSEAIRIVRETLLVNPYILTWRSEAHGICAMPSIMLPSTFAIGTPHSLLTLPRSALRASITTSPYPTPPRSLCGLSSLWRNPDSLIAQRFDSPQSLFGVLLDLCFAIPFWNHLTFSTILHFRA